jgi:hypothetical protein
MKMVKSLLLGGAAGLVAVASAQAADLPVKAKAVEYVKICSLYGEGFFYIPGTDTCLKIGGWVRLDSYFNQNSSDLAPISGGTGQNSRASNPDFNFRSRTVVSFDARSQTEWGTLRAYYRGGFELTGNSSQYANGTYYYERAFIQLGGWTLGRSQSFFDIFSSLWSYGGAFYGGGSATGAFGTNLAAYTASFGNGLSATLSLEDNNMRRNALWDATADGSAAGLFPVGNALGIGGTGGLGPMGPPTNGYTTCGVTLVGNDNTNGNANTTNGLNAVGCGWGDYAAVSIPDIVGNLRVDQAWGSAQISGALHQVRGNYYGNNFVVASGSFTGIAPSDVWGGAVNAGIMINLPWNPGDKFWAEGTYAIGAPSYIGLGRNNGTVSDYSRFDGNRVAAGFLLDGVFSNNLFTPFSGIQLSTSWTVAAAIEHYWTPALRTSLWGVYTGWTAGGTGNRIMCNSALSPVRSTATFASGGGTTTAVGTDLAAAGCNFDFNVWSVGSRTVWNPVKNLDVGLEVLYAEVDQKMDPARILYTFGGAGTLRRASMSRPISGHGLA